MSLKVFEGTIIQEFYDYNRVPLWIFNQDLNLDHHYFSSISPSILSSMAKHMKGLLRQCADRHFDMLCYENELYYLFTFEQANKSYYLIGGPMLLSPLYHISQMRQLSFSIQMNSDELKTIVDILPVVSLTTYSSSLRLMMLLLGKDVISTEEIHHYKFSDLQGSMDQIFLHERFDNIDNYRLHTPYREEVSLLNCVKNGDVLRLESTYRSLPETRYGNMSNNPLRQLFYGSIANTTLVTRYAIEGGLDEEIAFTLSDVYIKEMEHCTTLYELHLLNEKMALDFTRRVAELNGSCKPTYIKPIAICVDYIFKNIDKKITLNDLSKTVNLTPKYLSHLFHKETGETISAYVRKQKIQKAKNLLVHTNYSFSDISHYLAFYSQSYFISVFKKAVGLTPKEYRLKHSHASTTMKNY